MVAANGRSNGGTFINLHGTDLSGYNWKELQAGSKRLTLRDSSPTKTATARAANDSPTSRTPPGQIILNCTNGFNLQRRYSHVIGFTLTYNDFDYTGAVFPLRAELQHQRSLAQTSERKIPWRALRAQFQHSCSSSGPDSEQRWRMAEHGMACLT